MSAIVEVFAAVFALILELTWHASVALYHGLAAIFSPRHRAQFLKEWRKSTGSKITTVLLAGVAIVLIASMAWFWTNLFSPKPEPAPKPALAQVFTRDEQARLIITNDVDDLATEAGKIAIEKFKSTWNFRPSKKEIPEAPPPAAP
jgi:hypothetical protein